MAKINKRSVDGVNVGARDQYLWDDELKGFGLKVTPAGRKVYLIQYRIGGRKGRTRRVTIGTHGILTPDQARAEAKRLLGDVSAGRDPAAKKDNAGRELSFEGALQRFLAEYVDAKLKRSSAGEYHRAARLYVGPAFHRRSLSEITRDDINRLHLKLRDRPYQANRTLAFLSKMFNWAEKHNLRPDGSNPCRHLAKFPEAKRERFLSMEEITRLGDVLHLAETEGLPWDIDEERPSKHLPKENRRTRAGVYNVAAIRLLLLTGARLSEILTLKWAYVDFERRFLRLPDSKTGAKVVFLNEPAIQVLKALPRIEKNPYVICGERDGEHLVNLQKAWRRVRKAAGLENVRLHDLRHSFASIAAAGGMSLPIIGALLGHSQPATTARYAHLAADPLRQASAAVGSKISSAVIRTGK